MCRFAAKEKSMCRFAAKEKPATYCYTVNLFYDPNCSLSATRSVISMSTFLVTKPAVIQNSLFLL